MKAKLVCVIFHWIAVMLHTSFPWWDDSDHLYITLSSLLLTHFIIIINVSAQRSRCRFLCSYNCHVLSSRITCKLLYLNPASDIWAASSIWPPSHPGNQPAGKESLWVMKALRGSRSPLLYFPSAKLSLSFSLSLREELSFPKCKPFLWWEVYHKDLPWHLYTPNL